MKNILRLSWTFWSSYIVYQKNKKHVNLYKWIIHCVCIPWCILYIKLLMLYIECKNRIEIVHCWDQTNLTIYNSSIIIGFEPNNKQNTTQIQLLVWYWASFYLHLACIRIRSLFLLVLKWTQYCSYSQKSI